VVAGRDRVAGRRMRLFTRRGASIDGSLHRADEQREREYEETTAPGQAPLVHHDRPRLPRHANHTFASSVPRERADATPPSLQDSHIEVPSVVPIDTAVNEQRPIDTTATAAAAAAAAGTRVDRPDQGGRGGRRSVDVE
jgi:hypothetical protein